MLLVNALQSRFQQIHSLDKPQLQDEAMDRWIDDSMDWWIQCTSIGTSSTIRWNPNANAYRSIAWSTSLERIRSVSSNMVAHTCTDLTQAPECHRRDWPTHIGTMRMADNSFVKVGSFLISICHLRASVPRLGMKQGIFWRPAFATAKKVGITSYAKWLGVDMPTVIEE